MTGESGCTQVTEIIDQHRPQIEALQQYVEKALKTTKSAEDFLAIQSDIYFTVDMGTHSFADDVYMITNTGFDGDFMLRLCIRNHAQKWGVDKAYNLSKIWRDNR